jgi:intraflagellar transport protein 80
MRFKTSALKESKHTELVSCVAWMSTDDVVSISDDKKILKWNLVNSETKVNTNLKSSDSDYSYYVYIIVIGCS